MSADMETGPRDPDTRPEAASRPSRRGRGLLWAILAVVLAFGLGAGWQYLDAREAREGRDAAEQELVYQRMGNLLGAATVQAGYENYEPARQLASRFYSELDRHLSEDVADEAGSQALRGILRSRDDMITALSRSNADAEDLLAADFLRFHHAVGIDDPGPAVPATAGSGRTPLDGGADAEADGSGPAGGAGGPPGSDEE